MEDDDLLVEHGAGLVAAACRMLGSSREADDAVQEAWLRLRSSEDSAGGDVGGRLTSVVARVCLEVLGARTPRREDDAVPAGPAGQELVVVLATLAPAERLAFVLHDLFAMPDEEIAAILGRSTTAARQLASRARRRVHTPEVTLEADRVVHGRVVDAFLAAFRSGDLEELVWLLHPDAAMHADAAAVAAGSVTPAVGADAVAGAFAERAAGARPALLDGFAAAVGATGGRPWTVFGFTVVDGRIAEIEQIAEPSVLGELDLEWDSATP
ncbi:MAG: sigma factor-like helix-turn-helix DNA-binding protein [Nocardioidaceae bacterium]